MANCLPSLHVHVKLKTTNVTAKASWDWETQLYGKYLSRQVFFYEPYSTWYLSLFVDDPYEYYIKFFYEHYYINKQLFFIIR